MPRAMLGLLVLVTGCTTMGSSEPGQVAQAIVGGTINTGDPSIGVLYAQDGPNAYICTASLIAPKVLLTAAHCVSDQLHSATTKYGVYFGNDVNKATAASMLAVAEVHANPDWDLQHLDNGHDIAVVILKDPVTLATLPIRREPLDTVDIGKPLRLVGFGATDGQTLGGTGVKRQTTTALDAFDLVKLIYNDTMHLTCNGDSGGPALLARNGVEEIAGITSFGDQHCEMFGADTRVDIETDFVDGYMQQAQVPPAATPDPAATQEAAQPTTGTMAESPPTDTGHGCDFTSRSDARSALSVALAVLALCLARRARTTRATAARR